MRSLYRLLAAALIPALLMLLSACSSNPAQRDEASKVSTEEVATESSPELPNVELDSQLLYQILVAEFAGQEGALRLAAVSYLDAAEKTRDYRLARRATRIAIYARENNLALNGARLWVKLAPNDTEAHKSLAAMLIATGDAEQAKPHLDRLLQSKRQDSNHGYLLVATLLTADPDKERALRTMGELVQRQPDNQHALYAYAHLANQLGDNQLASTVSKELLRDYPEHVQGLILQAKVLHALGDVDGSLESARKALNTAPDNQQLRLTYARMLVDARQLKKARRQFTILSKSNPNDPDIIYALGLLALEAGDLDAAEAHFNKLLHYEQREEESRFAMAQIAEARQDYDRAIEWFSSIAQGERYLEAQLQAARLIARQHGLPRARDYLHELETQNGEERLQLFLGEAELLNDAGEYEQAMAVYDDGLASFINNKDLLYARALTAEKVDRLDILEHDLKLILESDPDNAQALNALGYTLVDRTKRYEEGFRYIERAYKLHPQDVPILDSMGWALYRLGRLDEALQYLKRATATVRDAEISAHLGEVLWAAGRHDEARDVWNEALKFAPDHKILQQTIQRFIP